MPFAGLRGEVGGGRRNDPRDILGLKRAFAALGRLRAPQGGFSEFIDAPLAGAIERFQADRGLLIDGFLRPGGETERFRWFTRCAARNPPDRRKSRADHSGAGCRSRKIKPCATDRGGPAGAGGAGAKIERA